MVTASVPQSRHSTASKMSNTKSSPIDIRTKKGLSAVSLSILRTTENRIASRNTSVEESTPGTSMKPSSGNLLTEAVTQSDSTPHVIARSAKKIKTSHPSKQTLLLTDSSQKDHKLKEPSVSELTINERNNIEDENGSFTSDNMNSSFDNELNEEIPMSLPPEAKPMKKYCVLYDQNFSILNRLADVESEVFKLQENVRTADQTQSKLCTKMANIEHTMGTLMSLQQQIMSNFHHFSPKLDNVGERLVSFSSTNTKLAEKINDTPSYLEQFAALSRILEDIASSISTLQSEMKQGSMEGNTTTDGNE